MGAQAATEAGCQAAQLLLAAPVTPKPRSPGPTPLPARPPVPGSVGALAAPEGLRVAAFDASPPPPRAPGTARRRLNPCRARRPPNLRTVPPASSLGIPPPGSEMEPAEATQTDGPGAAATAPACRQQPWLRDNTEPARPRQTAPGRGTLLALFRAGSAEGETN